MFFETKWMAVHGNDGYFKAIHDDDYYYCYYDDFNEWTSWNHYDETNVAIERPQPDLTLCRDVVASYTYDVAALDPWNTSYSRYYGVEEHYNDVFSNRVVKR